jgi:hypothetical protein
MRYANGAHGPLWSSQVAPGNENGLRIRVYGAKGGLEWNQVKLSFLVGTWAADTDDCAWWLCGPGCGETGDAYSAWPSGRLSRGLRKRLPRDSPRGSRSSGRRKA